MLRSAMRRKKLSAGEVARLAGLHRGTVSRWLLPGARLPGLADVLRVGRVLEIDQAKLLDAYQRRERATGNAPRRVAR